MAARLDVKVVHSLYHSLLEDSKDEIADRTKVEDILDPFPEKRFISDDCMDRIYTEDSEPKKTNCLLEYFLKEAKSAHLKKLFAILFRMDNLESLKLRDSLHTRIKEAEAQHSLEGSGDNVKREGKVVRQDIRDPEDDMTLIKETLRQINESSSIQIEILYLEDELERTRDMRAKSKAEKSRKSERILELQLEIRYKERRVQELRRDNERLLSRNNRRN